jgi:nucleoid DNA-binding protein
MVKGSRAGREELVSRVQSKLSLSTKKEADILVGAVISCLEGALLDHLEDDGFSMKLNSLGKFSVHHKPAIRRKVGFTGSMTQMPARRKVRFVSLGMLRQLEPKEKFRQRVNS